MDTQFMTRALELARLGIGYTKPNPMVGAVLIKNGEIIGEGYHMKYGGPHAEIQAFNNSSSEVSGSTMYVTLEPCSHYGKTPPCAKAIVEKGIKKVVIAMEDPNPEVSGKGIQILRENGIEVVTGVMEEAAKKLNEVFIKYISTKLPFCIMKTAMTLDGKIATYTGDSKWITNEESRKTVHMLRHQVAAIMVGIGTVMTDDPMLTTRLEEKEGKNPVRVIVDTKARIPLNSKVLECNPDRKTIIATTELADKDKIKAIEQMGAQVFIAPLRENQVDLAYLVKILGEHKLDSILLEGGSTLNYSALSQEIVDKIISFIAPKLIGGATAKTPVGGQGISLIRDSILLKDMTIVKSKDDLMIEAYIRKEG